jgi:hypothetical protein
MSNNQMKHLHTVYRMVTRMSMATRGRESGPTRTTYRDIVDIDLGGDGDSRIRNQTNIIGITACRCLEIASECSYPFAMLE